MTEQIKELSEEDVNLLLDKVKRKITGRFAVKIDGLWYYGFHSAKDIHRALKPQPYQPYLKS